MTVAIVVPLDLATIAGEGPRADVWGYVGGRLVVDHPDYWLTYGAHDGAEWCKADAVAGGLMAVDSAVPDCEVIVVHDADVVVSIPALKQAVRAVESGAVDWSIPHSLVNRLKRQPTEELMRSGKVSKLLLERPAYPGIEGGGIVVLRRALYEECPLDPRFLGWGSEDEAWGYALGVIGGKPWRGDAPMLHLYHPPAVHLARRSTNPASIRLWRAYRSARHDHDPTRMQALIAGALGRVPLDMRPRTQPAG